MVTAILPSLTDDSVAPAETTQRHTNNPRDSVALSLDSQATITPDNYRTTSGNSAVVEDWRNKSKSEKMGKPSALAGYVGVFTGCGALVALALFLPLPTTFGRIKGVTLGQAVTYSFYVVGAISFIVAVFVFFGLRNLKGEDGKGWSMLVGSTASNLDGSAVEGRRISWKQVGCREYLLQTQ